ncbi:DUF397 domain-containing protein [Streptomyces sp. JJ66]|uniref:DUF397 domain-containing protein n=1 Tax=Streptomyces sp. JJ66 TaxID=2803843 RepID=UPI001C5845FF|nr:DUF397 domain-containing protein [Streptomyces sp. JJ66]MBW1601680.1 DUF397 domain-containing protein [Streptomyces sp. JJ66]
MDLAPKATIWRKSSYSDDESGECVECAAIHGAEWRKSSHSGDDGGACVEVADLPHRIAVRDSKRPDGPAFTVSPAAFTAFTRATADAALHPHTR